jgi:hypothetical protein
MTVSPTRNAILLQFFHNSKAIALIFRVVFQHNPHYLHNLSSLKIVFATWDFQKSCWHRRTKVATRWKIFCGCPAMKMNSNFSTGRTNSRFFAAISVDFLRRFFVCVVEVAGVCAISWSLCWNLALSGSVWAWDWCKNCNHIQLRVEYTWQHVKYWIFISFLRFGPLLHNLQCTG